MRSDDKEQISIFADDPENTEYIKSEIYSVLQTFQSWSGLGREEAIVVMNKLFGYTFKGTAIFFLLAKRSMAECNALGFHGRRVGNPEISLQRRYEVMLWLQGEVRKRIPDATLVRISQYDIPEKDSWNHGGYEYEYHCMGGYEYLFSKDKPNRISPMISPNDEFKKLQEARDRAKETVMNALCNQTKRHTAKAMNDSERTTDDCP